MNKRENPFGRTGGESPVIQRVKPQVDVDDVIKRRCGVNCNPSEMSGAEMFAVVAEMKQTHGEKGVALENELMKVKQQLHKKLHLAAWVQENVLRTKLEDVTNQHRPSTAPAPLEEKKASDPHPEPASATNQ